MSAKSISGYLNVKLRLISVFIDHVNNIIFSRDSYCALHQFNTKHFQSPLKIIWIFLFFLCCRPSMPPLCHVRAGLCRGTFRLPVAAWFHLQIVTPMIVERQPECLHVTLAFHMRPTYSANKWLSWTVWLIKSIKINNHLVFFKPCTCLLRDTEHSEWNYMISWEKLGKPSFSLNNQFFKLLKGKMILNKPRFKSNSLWILL